MAERHIEGRRSIGASRQAYWQGWLPEQSAARGVVVLVHGFGEHSGRYAHVGARLAGAGMAAYAADHRGHGRTGGRPANIERMSLVVADLGRFVGFAAGQHPGAPLFVLGHSMGGLIALQYATEPDARLDGLLLSGPAVEVTVGSALQRRAAGVLSALTPQLGVTSLPVDRISRDREVVAAYENDPLVHHGAVPARTGAELLATATALPGRLGRLTVPVLLLHGGDDGLAAPSGSRMVHDAVASTDKTLHRYEGLYHEVFNEPERDRVLTDLVTWLEAHLPRGGE